MLKQLPPLDELFRALGDPTRRDMVERLSLGPATVSQLAQPLDMTLSAVVRTRTCRLEPVGLQRAEDWFAGQRAAWERRLDRLGDVLAADNPVSPPTTKGAGQ
jgi:Helix-turn-helix domain